MINDEVIVLKVVSRWWKAKGLRCRKKGLPFNLPDLVCCLHCTG